MMANNRPRLVTAVFCNSDAAGLDAFVTMILFYGSAEMGIRDEIAASNKLIIFIM
jgi:hypothetical protein